MTDHGLSATRYDEGLQVNDHAHRLQAEQLPQEGLQYAGHQHGELQGNGKPPPQGPYEYTPTTRLGSNMNQDRNPWGLRPLTFGLLIALITSIVVGAVVGGGVGGALSSSNHSKYEERQCFRVEC
jgi:hypothetical protein